MLENETGNRESLHKNLNILLLGQTGVGKSTFINALANYMHFNDFDSSVKSNLSPLVPLKFTLYDENLKANKISWGSASNEQIQPGQSSTQKCKAHEITFNELLIRIFDTPGIGDTRGVEQDQINLENVLETIKDNEKLHCICLLLKPNESKLSTNFEYCIKGILNWLPKSAILNIVFVFTNSSETFYKPGDTVVPLMSILNAIEDDSPDVKIVFEKSNVFCIDNAGFRHIVATQMNNIYSSTQEKEMKDGWKRSRKECLRLIKSITNGQNKSPIQIQNIIFLNTARTCAGEMLQPLIETVKNFENNRLILKEQTEKIKELKNIKNEKQKLLPMPIIISLRYTKLSHPHTVCVSERCALAFKIGDITKYHYWKYCCHDRNERFTSGNSSNTEYDIIFDEKTGICKECGCHKSQHTSTNYDSQVKENILEEETSEIGQSMIDKLELKIEKYKSDEEKLFKNMAKLIVFIQQNSMFPYLDAFESSIHHILNQETFHANSINVNLDSFLKTYLSKKAFYLEEPQKRLTNSSVIKVIDKLNSIESSGETLAKKITVKKNKNKQMSKWIKISGLIILLILALVGLIILIMVLTKG